MRRHLPITIPHPLPAPTVGALVLVLILRNLRLN